ncbi:MAG: hypothetical protein LBK75_08660 [Oscillospiraceae bacterium]|jgi:hypothetical protein|nr:hypothetical protein [Oscillospiraceae bacterium]
MSGFKSMIAADNQNVFLNVDEFAEPHTVIYDGETYGGIPVVLSGLKEQERRQLVSAGDHAQGLYLVTTVMHCALSDLGGKQPEKGMRIKISDGSEYYREFYVAASTCDIGMVRAELEAIDE